jgi:hypothetical protein
VRKISWIGVGWQIKRLQDIKVLVLCFGFIVLWSMFCVPLEVLPLWMFKYVWTNMIFIVAPPN